MADDKKNIPEAAPPAEAPASTVEKAAHGKGKGRQARRGRSPKESKAAPDKPKPPKPRDKKVPKQARPGETCRG